MEVIKDFIRNIIASIGLVLWVYSYYKMLCYLSKAIRKARGDDR